MSGGSSAPAGNTTTTQVSDPWSVQQPYLTKGFQGASNLYQNYSPSYFPSSTVAPLNPTQNVANVNSTMLGLGGIPALNSADNAVAGVDSGAFLNSSNPAFKSMANQVLAASEPSLESTFAGAGRGDSPGAAYAVSQGADTALGSLAYTNYNDQIKNMLSGAQVAPGIDYAKVADAGLAQSTGATEQNQTQSQITDAVNRWNFGQQLPYNTQNTFDQMINGTYGSTNTTTQPYFGPSTGSQVAQGVSTAASVAMAAAAVASMF